MIKLMRGLNEENQTEFYFVGLDSYDDFDVVVTIIKNRDLVIIDKYDGIYSRAATFELNGKIFKFAYHEDVGLYAAANNQANTEWLYDILSDVIKTINLEESL
jgi:hypothetical protein